MSSVASAVGSVRQDLNRNAPPNRRLCFRLLWEVTRRLGWRYKLYVPAVMLISGVFLLPPKLLQFFAEGTATLASVSAERFVFLLVVFGLAVAISLWLAVFLQNIVGEWLRLTVSIASKTDAHRKAQPLTHNLPGQRRLREQAWQHDREDQSRYQEDTHVLSTL